MWFNPRQASHCDVVHPYSAKKNHPSLAKMAVAKIGHDVTVTYLDMHDDAVMGHLFFTLSNRPFLALGVSP